MREVKKLTRRDFLRLSAAVTTGAIMAACRPAAPTPAPKKAEEKVPTVVPKPAEAVELITWMVDRRTINEMSKEVLKSEFEERNPDIKVKPEFQ